MHACNPAPDLSALCSVKAATEIALSLVSVAAVCVAVASAAVARSSAACKTRKEWDKFSVRSAHNDHLVYTGLMNCPE
jgi:hypothetical protein